MSITIEQKKKLRRFYRENPFEFFVEVLGCTPNKNQRQIIESVAANEETAIKSCHSLGKDWTCARVLLWFLCTHFPALVISTGPTDRQVKNILWQEVAIAYSRARAPMGGRMLTQELYISSEQRALGFTANDADRFQGFHCPNIMIILDEAAAIDSEIYNGIDSCLASGIKTRRLEIGNPTDPTSYFCRSFKTPGIAKLSFSAFDTPNFTHFGITQDDIADGSWQDKIGDSELPAPWLVTPAWVAKRYARWGPENPLYKSRVMAEFPTEGEDTLIPLAQIEAAQSRALDPGTPNLLGVDVARYGTDTSVIAHRRGPVVRIVQRFGKVDTMITAGYARKHRYETGADRICVDVIGVGAGVADRLREQREPVKDSNAAERSSNPEMYANARAEWYWNLRTAFEREEIDLDPRDEDLAAQLSDIRWKPDSKGRVTIEKKEEMKKRMGCSPDDADAVAMTYGSELQYIEKLKRAFQGDWANPKS